MLISFHVETELCSTHSERGDYFALVFLLLLVDNKSEVSDERVDLWKHGKKQQRTVQDEKSTLASLLHETEAFDATLSAGIDVENGENERADSRKDMNETFVLAIAKQRIRVRAFDPRNQQDDEGDEVGQAERAVQQQRCLRRAIVAFEQSTQEDKPVHCQGDPHD